VGVQGGGGAGGSIRLAAGALGDVGLTLPYLGKGPGERICRMRDGAVRAKKGTTGCSGSTWQRLMGAADFKLKWITDAAPSAVCGGRGRFLISAPVPTARVLGYAPASVPKSCSRAWPPCVHRTDRGDTGLETMGSLCCGDALAASSVAWGTLEAVGSRFLSVPAASAASQATCASGAVLALPGAEGWGGSGETFMETGDLCPLSGGNGGCHGDSFSK